MNILASILELDYHKTKNPDSRGLILETPARIEFLPAIISSTTASKFLTSTRLTSEGRIRSGIFKSQENLDVYLVPLIDAAYKLSISQSWGNIFESDEPAVAYIKASADLDESPFTFLVKSGHGISSGDTEGTSVSKKYLGARLVEWDQNYSVVFSRPDLVGLLTQFSNSHASILLHNVRLGMAFVKYPT